MKSTMQCPKCGRKLSEDDILRLGEKAILKLSAAILGRRGTGAAKSRGSEKMREVGRLGGLAKARNQAKAAKAKAKGKKT